MTTETSPKPRALGHSIFKIITCILGALILGSLFAGGQFLGFNSLRRGLDINQFGNLQVFIPSFIGGSAMRFVLNYVILLGIPLGGWIGWRFPWFIVFLLVLLGFALMLFVQFANMIG